MTHWPYAPQYDINEKDHNALVVSIGRRRPIKLCGIDSHGFFLGIGYMFEGKEIKYKIALVPCMAHKEKSAWGRGVILTRTGKSWKLQKPVSTAFYPDGKTRQRRGSRLKTKNGKPVHLNRQSDSLGEEAK